jgi:hypothetical protein
MLVKKTVSLLLRIALVGACLVYAFWGINFALLWQAFGRFGFVAILVTTASTFAGYWLMALRMNFLSGYTCGNAVGLKAFLLSMAVNNVVPAKLGELAKAFYLRKECSYSLSQSISIVFWERFFDLNAILAMGLAVAFHFKLWGAIIPLGLGVGAIWACLFFVRKWPDKAERLIALIPFERLREFIIEVKLQLVHGVTLRYLIILGIYTALVWILYAVPTFLTINWVAGLKLTTGQTLAVFVLSALGMAMPSSPGAVGVFEAAVVGGLNHLFHVDKELALAIGLLIHMMQYIPTTIAGLLVLAKSGLSLKNLRARDKGLET